MCVQTGSVYVHIEFTIDVSLFMQLGDAQQVCPLLLATDPSLIPWERGLEVKLVTAVCQWVSIPECLTVRAWQWGKKSVRPDEKAGGINNELMK